ncbi:hypothetical protein L484_001387 [Morus notabilis]|uniref:DUF7890 domain-containing protein n=1 Tax=Morus notabilis TaxID=981085 RepID=W9QTX2_9ROSA|nr:hypothetical protein L484_001387 [Morus notabilis]
MLNSFVTFYNRISPDEKALEHRKSNAKSIIYRDELSKTKQAKRKPKKGDSLEFSEPLIEKESGVKTVSSRAEEERSGVIRVKVTMTKEEANRLLSRCKDGGVLKFKDVARELVQIPVNRVQVFNLPSTSCSGNTVLKTIPEEF